MPSVPSPTSDEASSSKAGIQTSSDGTRHIPASVRPDGTLRKEIKIRPGYRPPEDIEKYKNRTAEAFRNRGKGGVPGAESIEDSKGKDAGAGAAGKNAKRREARKKAAAEKEGSEASEGKKAESHEGKAGANGGKANGVKKEELKEEVDPEVEKQKEAKKLVKKLRQARELKDKKESGAALLPEQFEKVIRINELIRQLDALGFDGEGEKKVEGAGEEG